jgi:acyl-CoA synthetase (AMP-forming)/AMP-acid ligase II
VIAPHEDLFSPPRLSDLLIHERIEFAEFVPHVLGHVVSHLESTERTLPDLKLLVIGSDVWLGSEWARARKVCNDDVRMINAYGLNETSVDCTYFEDSAADEPPKAYVPIGKPFLNHRVYVLNERGRPVPAGVPGELFIGGSGVVRGYLNQPEITAERFLPDPFAVEPGGRMLRTGDRVRMLPDGNLEMLGRMDSQVKIRAFRVELGEIECGLQGHPMVRQAVAMVCDDETGERQLVAYLVGDQALNVAHVRRHLNDRFPSYMVPNFFVFLDEMPLTANGLKVDRAKLPPPDWGARPAVDAFVAPETEMERTLAEIWLDVLPVDRIGAHDKFMDLGGHSLLLIPVLARIEKELQLRLLPGEIILATLRQLAAAAEKRLLEPGPVGRSGFLSRVLGRG